MKHFDFFTTLTFEFGQKSKLQSELLPSLDVFVLSLILFALKFLYGLDDKCELYRSADARKFNEV